MPLDHLVIADMATGYETDRTPFIINNDAFPLLNNAYIWRGRLPRKRGTFLLGRLQRNLASQSLGNTDGSGNFSGNIFTILGLHTAQPNASIVFAGLSIVVGADTFTAPSPPDGTLSGSTMGTGTINYATGALTLTGAPAATAVLITFGYYPGLPVMGLEDFDIGLVNEPLLIAFDTQYSYGINQGTNIFYDVTFYKTTHTPFVWHGADYQQFYTTNYLGVNTVADTPDKSGCMWATNGNPGFHFQNISGVTVGNPTIITTAVPHNLITGDWVWFNENSGADAPTIFNGKSFQITKTGANTFTVPLDSTAKALNNDGIFESMTSSGITPTQDGIRWYDGDPTVSNDFGWVNFAPPLNQYDSVTNPHPFYLVGANLITQFKNRLIFSGVYLTTTAPGAPVQFYPNRIVYSQVGTPFYSSPLPFPIATQPPDPTAWFQNVAGKGGFLTSPLDQEIVTIAPNQDVLIYGMEAAQLKLVYTFDDSLPFIFQTVNSELGSQNQFSAVTLDEGVLSIGDYGIIITNQTDAKRIDLQIPDQVFDISVSNNNNQRVTAIRDYRNEWVYFTYCPGENTLSAFPNKTLLYNYRDNNWATFDENYTHYGTFRRSTNRTWASIGSLYGTWSNWTDPWNFGANEAFFPQIVGGNQHGFVLVKGQGTNEGNSQYITAVTITAAPQVTITSPNHCLNSGDFVGLSGMIGVTIQDLSSNPLTIFKVKIVDANNFIIIPNVPFTASGTYLGGGVYKRLSIPEIQTKQFPIYWKDGRGCRVGLQRYLLQTTSTGQLTAQVFTNQNPDIASNDPTINPYLIYSNVVLTSPEPSLYGANPSYLSAQDQIWHRVSNSFTGSTVQMGFTLSDDQMYNPLVNTQEIIVHAIVLDLYPGTTLA